MLGVAPGEAITNGERDDHWMIAFVGVLPDVSAPRFKAADVPSGG